MRLVAKKVYPVVYCTMVCTVCHVRRNGDEGAEEEDESEDGSKGIVLYTSTVL